jgi:ribose 5-phosphate isomerase RpiB
VWALLLGPSQKKVLHVGVKVKYCSVCDSAKDKKKFHNMTVLKIGIRVVGKWKKK